MQDIIITTYFIALSVLFLFGSGGFIMIYYYFRYRNAGRPQPPAPETLPPVTVQLPVYNEFYVVGRLIDAVCALDYPKHLLEIQILDDSTDETTSVIADRATFYRDCGYKITHVRRGNREGFKAGALRHGMESATGEFIAIFDADFVPRREFLRKTLPWFSEPTLGLVQTRWDHLNADDSFMTRVQAMALDGHFVIEQQVRDKAGMFINFNGTAGIWRKSCIIDAGNWEGDTLTEDLDLSYRAQLRGWKFKFLNDFTSPAELPAEMNALKAQQHRWTKGSIETARKILPRVWASALPLRRKLQSTQHLTGNLAFPFILLAGLLNPPLIFIKHQGGHDHYFTIMGFFVFAFAGSFLFYLYSQKDVYPDWRRRIMMFPLFMAGSMGLSVSNSRAVFQGLIGLKTEFVRTPKYSTNVAGQSKGRKYGTRKITAVTIAESLMALYCSAGVVISIYYVELAAVPFQLLFSGGFGMVAWMSIKSALGLTKQADRATRPAPVHPEDLPAVAEQQGQGTRIGSR
jgi:cellulose synthase/poly-beta-1,6-N-acetylglucosamine synthase-like glycosyltransferase